MPASRSRVRGRITASAGGPAASAVAVTAAGIFFFLRSSGTATAAASAAAAAPFTSGRHGDEMLPFLAKARASLWGPGVRGRLKPCTRGCRYSYVASTGLAPASTGTTPTVALLENLPDAVMLIDDGGSVAYAN